MNARNLAILSFAALLFIGVAVWVGHSRAPQNAEQQKLYPDLKGNLEKIDAIRIYKAGDQLAVEMARDGSVWSMKQRDNYPADAAKIRTLLIDLEGAVLREQKTATAANYPALGVQDLTDAATTGVRVELDGGSSPVKLIVGKRDSVTRATYVRRAGDAQSWSIGMELEVSADIAQWLKRDVVNIGADRIQEAVVQLSGVASYSVFKNKRADANFDVKGVPKGREVNSVSAPNGLAQALVALQVDDVRPIKELASEKNPSRTVFRAFDGLVVECSGYTIGERRWVTFHASFDPELAKRFHLVTQAPDPKDQALDMKPDTKQSAEKEEVAKDAKASAIDSERSLEAAVKKGQDEATAINATTDAWAFALPAYKYDAIFKPLEELLKKPEMLKKKSP